MAQTAMAQSDVIARQQQNGWSVPTHSGTYVSPGNSNSYLISGVLLEISPNYMSQTYYEQVRQCRQERVPVQTNPRPRAGIAGTIVQGGVGSIEGAIGAIIGGVIGNEIGKGKGKSTRNAATALGFILGAQVGHQGSPQAGVTYQTVTNCYLQNVPHTRRVLDGYHLTVKADTGHIVKAYDRSGKNYRVGERVDIVVNYMITN